MSARTVLGIDAAWTARQPSGVALAAEHDGRWRLVAAEPSYGHFVAQAAGEAAPARAAGALPDPAALIAAARALTGSAPDLVAIDMPLARFPIIGRRAADNEVSRTYGGRKCGTHSPSAERPGAISDALTRDFSACGYPLLTQQTAAPGLIEVYPHPALVEFTGAAERLPYKHAKTRTYWPDAGCQERHVRLAEVWDAITATLDTLITGTADHLAAGGLVGKAREDVLDAVTCCAVAIAVLEDRAIAYGDADAAIWIPAPGVSRATRPAAQA